MKKCLILISFLVLILSLSSCNKDKINDINEDKTEQIDIEKGETVDEVSINLEDKTIKLNNKMEGKEFYQTLFQGVFGRDYADFIFDKGQENGARPCQVIYEENLLEEYKNETSYESEKIELKSGKDQYNRTLSYNNYILDIKEDSSYKVFAEKTIDLIKNVNETREENHSKTTVFGNQTKILPTDADFNPEYNPLLQCNDIVYFSSNEENAPENGIYEKKYTSPQDYANKNVSTEDYFREAYSSLYKYSYDSISIKLKFNSVAINCDEWIDDYIQYEYELTDRYIILNYRALFDIIGVFEYYEASATIQDLKELVEESKNNRSYYEVIAYIDYHNENFTQNGLISCECLIEDLYRVKISKGTYDELYYPQFAGTEYEINGKYQTKYIWKPLDISEAEIEKKKTELIESLK